VPEVTGGRDRPRAGRPSLTLTIFVSGIASAEAFGTPYVVRDIVHAVCELAASFAQRFAFAGQLVQVRVLAAELDQEQDFDASFRQRVDGSGGYARRVYLSARMDCCSP
jgi:hypothetical protein